jgi:amino acid transporter
VTGEATLPDQAQAPARRHRDDGLVRGIGTAGLSANIVNGVVGAGIFTLPAAVALEAGAAAPLTYVLCAVIMAGVVVCFAEAGSRVPTSGGAYGTVEAALGPAAGFVTGILLILSDVLASGGLAAAVADLLGSVSPALGPGLGRTAVILAIYALVCGANLVSVRRTARLITGVTAVKLLPLFAFLGLGLWSLGMAPPAGPPLPPVTAGGFGRGMILTMFAFSGMETAMMASGEVRAPNRTIPRALFGAMLLVLVLYMGVQLSAQHLLGGNLAQAAAPLAEASGRIAAPFRVAMLAAAGLSMLAWLASDVLGTSRMVFAFSRDGLLPAWLGVVHPRSHVPARAVVAYTACGLMLALTGSFLELIVLSSLTVTCVYILTCAAAVILRRRDVALAGTPLRVPGLTAAAAVGIAAMVALVLAAQWREIGGLVLVLGLSLGVFAVMKRKKAVLF